MFMNMYITHRDIQSLTHFYSPSLYPFSNFFLGTLSQTHPEMCCTSILGISHSNQIYNQYEQAHTILTVYPSNKHAVCCNNLHACLVSEEQLC